MGADAGMANGKDNTPPPCCLFVKTAGARGEGGRGVVPRLEDDRVGLEKAGRVEGVDVETIIKVAWTKS